VDYVKIEIPQRLDSKPRTINKSPGLEIQPKYFVKKFHPLNDENVIFKYFQIYITNLKQGLKANPHARLEIEAND